MSKDIKNRKILNVRFDNVTLSETVDLVKKWLKEDKQRHIITPNPEIVLLAQKNKKLKEIINKSALNIPDGIGIIFASILFPGEKLKERVTGTDLMREISANSAEPIFFLGAAQGVAENLKKTYQKTYPNINIVGTHAGSPSQKEENQIIEKINQSGAKILFVAYGAPAQELWINRNLKNLTTVKVAIGVGGAFDFESGKIKRAPILMQKIGLEWLFRLILEPKRIGRIIKATIVFPTMVALSFFKKN